MDKSKTLRMGLVATSVLALASAYGCDQPNPYKVQGTPPNCPPAPADIGGAASPAPGANQTTPGSTPQHDDPGQLDPKPTPEPTTELDQRVVDYSEALRVASLKLVGALPSNALIYEVAEAGDESAKRAIYEALVDEMMDPDNEAYSDKFATRLLNFYRQEFHIAQDPINPQSPSRDTAPTFAARLMYEEGNWQDLLTASSNTCPTWDADNGFVDGECSNVASMPDGIQPVGVLTDPGILALYFGNLAFRRNRFFQETFLCRYGNDPVPEISVDGPDMGDFCGSEDGGPFSPPPAYQGAWGFDTIAGECNGGRIDFHEFNATTICAQCHGTWNHRSPLFAKFDEVGNWKMEGFAVKVPVENEPFAELSDWLSPSELELDKPFAWRKDLPRVADLAEMGQVMANDPEVITCAVKRMWNYAMSHGDVVDNQAHVPQQVVAELVEDFKVNGYNMKQTLRSILLHDDFVSF